VVELQDSTNAGLIRDLGREPEAVRGKLQQIVCLSTDRRLEPKQHGREAVVRRVLGVDFGQVRQEALEQRDVRRSALR
jgi:hypothetical protein